MKRNSSIHSSRFPDYRLQPTSKTIVTFEERPAGSPMAIKAWFYPGKNFGSEFVYPKPKAIELAKANKVPVPATTAEVPAATITESDIATLKTAPLKAEQPSEEEIEAAEAFETTAPNAELPDSLPATASGMPLVGLVGLLSLGAAGTMRFAAAKTK